MKRISVLATIVILLWLLTTSNLMAVKFLWKDEKGAHIYGCNGFCGKVKVKKTSRGVFRVYSIPFSGDIEAYYEKQAAMKACREIAMGNSEKQNPTVNQDEYGCE